ncbi:hypothetical protein HPB50_017258 [Hyalomma asiaticum]|uniref:Uncharacterized protein n=1 Tax=Hyalomma asiaticum TaxID=266040 RepID=A0ACB7SGA9_HYAAI|nr:hypothetical protein HPB50_017258 [Hyalomma asiaticum]
MRRPAHQDAGTQENRPAVLFNAGCRCLQIYSHQISSGLRNRTNPYNDATATTLRGRVARGKKRSCVSSHRRPHLKPQEAAVIVIGANAPIVATIRALVADDFVRWGKGTRFTTS